MKRSKELDRFITALRRLIEKRDKERLTAVFRALASLSLEELELVLAGLDYAERMESLLAKVAADREDARAREAVIKVEARRLGEEFFARRERLAPSEDGETRRG
jgi:predicted CopG family antitoxin